MLHQGNTPRGRLNLYRSYNFIEGDKDPVIDKIRTIVQDEGLKYNEIHVLSGVAATTLYEWFHGKTRKPQHCTLAAVASALGYDWELVKKKAVNYKTELPKAKAELEGQTNGHARKPHARPQARAHPRTRARARKAA